MIVNKEPREGRWDRHRVRALRSYMGLTQQELAQQMGTRQQTISEWETGLYQPRGTSRTLLAIIAERAGFDYVVDSAGAAQVNSGTSVTSNDGISGA